MSCKEYLKAKNLVDIFEGSTKVIFYDSSTSKYLDYSVGLSVSQYVISELCDILGKDNVVVK